MRYVITRFTCRSGDVFESHNIISKREDGTYMTPAEVLGWRFEHVPQPCADGVPVVAVEIFLH